MSKFDKRFISVSQERTTPQSLFDKLNEEFHFEWDLAADVKNTKCSKFYTKEDDGLKQKWNGACWLNPPYGDKSSTIAKWVKKAFDESLSNPNLTVVMLIPARTNTKWFHQYCMKACELKFICGRPCFGDVPHGLPQPLVLIVFKKSDHTRFSSFYLK
jgi:phage N-6-adenine-methyltransferase